MKTSNSIDKKRHAVWALYLTVAGLVLLPACKPAEKAADETPPKQGESIEERREQNDQIKDLVGTEDLILDLSPRLARFSEYLQRSISSNDAEAGKLELPVDFSECKSIIGLDAVTPDSVFHQSEKYPSFIKSGYWPLTSSAETANNPWQSLTSLKADWQTFKLGVVSGDFDNPEQTRFTIHAKSEGRGVSEIENRYYGFKGIQDITFEYRTGQWALAQWKQLEFKIIQSPSLLFGSSLEQAFPDDASRALAERSYMDEIVLATSESGEFALPKDKYIPWTTMTADHVFPSVSVVDFNSDGQDDLFLTARWGPTQLLKNMGDGTFTDVTKGSGLEFDYLVNCALFVDLDNDGDQDALIGRSMEPARYFQNNNGTFTDVSKSLSDFVSHDQYFVSGISASDVNRDGLVDIYMSTYPPLAKKETGFEHQFLNAFEREKYIELKEKNDRWVDTPGTANVLFMNRGGGRLERVPYDDVLSQWRRSYQAVWGDIDNDGDDDLYVCNDFAPDALLRNDTPRGSKEPLFVDISNDQLTSDGIGFGMGASYGDFDQDGDVDLYVSNMFSKAGNRIFKKLDSVDSRIRGAAAGCFLFENQDGKFQQKAGSDDGLYHVNQVGWSYGGQWSDFDNDGRLDIYVPTGFFTAPNELDTKVDL
ncbi:MAG: VCBS repeat-containing protein [Planctomycetota bacterium]